MNHNQLKRLYNFQKTFQDNPWKNWEYLSWEEEGEEAWMPLTKEPSFDKDIKYRVKNLDFLDGKSYYIPDYFPDTSPSCRKYIWEDDDLDNIWLKQGLIFFDKDEASEVFNLFVQFLNS